MSSDSSLTVSIVMPAFNAEATIGAAVSGVLSQAHQAVELIVVDDGSTDRTAEIVAAYGDRVTLVRIANGGPGVARNAGIARANGRFIALCDADDILLPNAISSGLAALMSSGNRCIVTQEAHILTDTGMAHGRNLIRRTFPKANQRLAILERNFIGIFTVAPREMYEEVGGFDESLRLLEDWDLWARAIYAGWRVVLQTSPVAIYRLGEGSLSTDQRRFETERTIFRKFQRIYEGQLTEAERAFLQFRVERSPTRAAEMALASLRAGETVAARTYFSEVRSLSPTRPWVRLKAGLAAHSSLAVAALRLRQRRTDGRLGSRVARKQ